MQAVYNRHLPGATDDGDYQNEDQLEEGSWATRGHGIQMMGRLRAGTLQLGHNCPYG